MHEFVVSVAVGIAVCLAGLALWAVVLRAFGIYVFTRRPEKHASTRKRILAMGKRRCILIFGMLGYPFSLGLGIVAADLMSSYSTGWRGAAIKLVLFAVLGGWYYGAKTWNQSYRGEVPFPPPYLLRK